MNNTRQYGILYPDGEVQDVTKDRDKALRALRKVHDYADDPLCGPGERATYRDAVLVTRDWSEE